MVHLETHDKYEDSFSSVQSKIQMSFTVHAQKKATTYLSEELQSEREGIGY